MDSRDSLLTKEEAESVRAPIERARTMPRRAFQSREFFDAELERVFSRNWVALCFAGEVANPGDVLPLDAFDQPLVVTRDGSGDVHVFHNVVPYDGCLAVIEPESGLREITTPYHGWRYDLSGKLVSAPFWDGSAEGSLDAMGGHPRDLSRVESHIEMGVVFVDLSGNAGSFERFFEPLRRVLAEYDLDGLALGVEESGSPEIRRAELQTNWKILVENDCMNILHESFVHELYRKSPEVPRVDEQGRPRFVTHVEAPVFAFSYAKADVEKTYPASPAPTIGVGSSATPTRGYFVTVYPNLTMAVTPQGISPCIVWPAAPDACVVAVAGLFEAQYAQAASAAKDRHATDAVFEEAFAEDARIVEAIQSARRSPAFESHYYAPLWDELHYRFNQRLLDDLERT